MSLSIKCRPKTLEEVRGNEDTIRSLESVLSRPRESIQHTFLFTGPSGCGKTTLGRIISTRLGCVGMDYHEVDTTLYRKTNDIEDILSQAYLSPWEGEIQVWLLDEAHQIGVGGNSPSNKAQNALLKMLEEPPPHTYFILCTTNPEMLLTTIRSRCAPFEVSPLSPLTMETFLKEVSRSERKRVPTDVIEQIVSASFGSCRTALQLLDKIINLNPEDMLIITEQAVAKENQVIELCRAVFQRSGWKQVAELLKGLEKEAPESIRLAVRGYCGNILLTGKDNAQAYVVMDCFRAPFYTDGRNCLIQAAYEAVESIKDTK